MSQVGTEGEDKSAMECRRTVVESKIWSGEILSDGQDSKIGKLGNLDKIGAGLDHDSESVMPI